MSWSCTDLLHYMGKGVCCQQFRCLKHSSHWSHFNTISSLSASLWDQFEAVVKSARWNLSPSFLLKQPVKTFNLTAITDTDINYPTAITALKWSSCCGFDSERLLHKNTQYVLPMGLFYFSGLTLSLKLVFPRLATSRLPNTSWRERWEAASK